MAKKSISDIVLRAVVDTSGVAAGLNNIGSQVAGRQFGQTAGGPIGASGAAGGFVNPHGGGAGAGAAATAAAAAAGAAAGRGVGGAGPGGAAMREAMAVTGNPLTNLLSKRYVAPRFRKQEDLLKAAKLAQDAGSGMAARAYVREALREGAAGAMASRRLSRFAETRAGRFAGGAVGLASQVAGLSTKAGQMMGMGRFAPLGGAAMVAGGIGYAGVRLGQLGNEGMPSRFSDITRFQFGADREAARQLKRDWNPANRKAPLGFIDRFLVEGRKANNGQATWLEKGIKFAGETYQQKAAQMGAASATLGGTLSTMAGLASPLGMMYQQGAEMKGGSTVSNLMEVASPPYMMYMTLKRMFN